MRSTGEVMGIDTTFGKAFFKAELAAGTLLPTEGTVFLSLADGDKPAGLVVARRLRELGLGIAATTGTADVPGQLRRQPVDQVVGKISEGHGINAVNLIAGGEIAFVDQHPAGPGGGRSDGEQIRKAANTQPGQLGHHRRGRARRRAGHGRAGRPRPVGPLRCRSITRSDGPRPICGLGSGRVELPNPVMTASGTAGHGAELPSFFDLADLGALVVKSLAAFEWDGNPAPRVHPAGVGMINAVGLQGPGVSAWLADDLPALVATGARVVVSIWGRSRRRLPARRRAARPTPRRAWSPSRSTCRARTSRVAGASSPTTPRCRPR